MKPTIYTVGDLRSVPSGILQKCHKCGGEYSATYGDYFMASDSRPLTCCGRPVALVTRRTVYEEIGIRG